MLEGQALAGGIFFRSVGQNYALFCGRHRRRSRQQRRRDSRIGAPVAGWAFPGAGAAFTWDIANPGPGSAYAFANGAAILIPPDATQQVTTTSDERGQTYLLPRRRTGYHAHF